MDTVRRFLPSGNAKEETFMNNNVKETNRPLDQEELSLDQEAIVTGGVQPTGINTACINTACINTARINTARINTANFNTANINDSRL